MNKLTLLSIVTVAAYASGMQAQSKESHVDNRKVQVCNHWDSDIKIGFMKNSGALQLIRHDQCDPKIPQEIGQFSYLVVDGTMYTLKRSYANKRVTDASTNKASSGSPKNITVRYDDGTLDIYRWDSVSKMFVNQNPGN